jgi:hypothetical protein
LALIRMFSSRDAIGFLVVQQQESAQCGTLLARLAQSPPSTAEARLGQQLLSGMRPRRQIAGGVVELLGDVVKVSSGAVLQQADVLEPVRGHRHLATGSLQPGLRPWPLGQQPQVVGLWSLVWMRDPLARDQPAQLTADGFGRSSFTFR